MSNPNLPLGIALVCGAAACALTLVISDVGAGGGVALGAVVAGAALILQGNKPAEEKEVSHSQPKAPKKKKPVAHTNSSPAPSSPVEEKKKPKKKSKAEKPEASPKAAAPKSPAPKTPAPKSPAPKSPAPAPQQQKPAAKTPQKSSGDEKELTKTQLQKLKKKQKKESEEKAKAEEKALEVKREAAQAKKAAKAASKKKEPVTPQPQANAYSSGEDTKEEELEDGWEKPKPRNTVRIRSPQDDKKRREAAAKAKEAKSPTGGEAKTVIEVRVPQAKHGLIIGKGGATLDLIQKETKAKVTMPKKGGGLGVIITGTPEQVAEAQQVITDLYTKGYSQLTHPNFQSGEIILENSAQVGRIAGPGGAYLKAIQKHSKATLQLPDKPVEKPGKKGEKPDNKNGPKPVIKISGKLDQITNAKLAIMTLLDQGYCEYTHPGWVSEEYNFQHEYLGRLIGSEGAKIRQIQDDFDVKITTPKEGDNKDTIIIKGKPESIEAAKEAIHELTIEKEAAPEVLPVPAADDPWNQEVPQEAEW